MKVIRIADLGIRPGMDIAGRMNQLFHENPEDTEYSFEPGTYHLSSRDADGVSISLSNSDQLPVLKAGMLMQGMRNIRLIGNGALLLCHGQLSAMALVDSGNIIIKGLTIDYDPTHNGEGVIIRATPAFVDVGVDLRRYPFKVEEGRLFFFNGEEYTPYFGAMEFDADTRRTAYLKGDKFRSDRQEELSPGIIRFHGTFKPLPAVGNLLTLRYSPRIHPGILVHHCSEVSLDCITLHNTCGLGVLSQFSRDLRYSRITMRPNETDGRRVLSCHDDGLHFSNDCGSISVDNCYFHGLMDDPINVHGTALRIREITGGHSLTAEFAHGQSSAFPLWAKPGQEISFIEHMTMRSLGTLPVEKFRLLGIGGCAVSFSGSLPSGLQPGDALENIDNTPQVTITNSYFGSCRARGILASTPRPVVIDNNVFESSGSAVLIPGDANAWFESGACSDVLIRRNHFTDGCMVSMYQFCEGVISICPEIPAPRVDIPFHRHIRIEENTFHVFDAPVLYAFCTRDLSFTGNTIIRSRAYAPWHPRRAMVTLRVCSDTTVKNNRFVGDVLSSEIVCE